MIFGQGMVFCENGSLDIVESAHLLKVTAPKKNTLLRAGKDLAIGRLRNKRICLKSC